VTRKVNLSDGKRVLEGWSAHRDSLCRDEKQAMARHFAMHEFLVREGTNPETARRASVASINVNPDTTPNIIVKEALKWISEHPATFDITWYTPGTLVPSTLLDFRQANPQLQKAAQLFLFPGLVDVNIQSVIGPEAEEFAEGLDAGFTYAFLSCAYCDLRAGTVRFHHPTELRLQRACALRRARKKFLFLDPTKFEDEERPTYTIKELLSTSQSVTLYTVSSQKDDWIKTTFETLRGSTLVKPVAGTQAHDQADLKSLRLVIVGRSGKAPFVSQPLTGFLRSE